MDCDSLEAGNRTTRTVVGRRAKSQTLDKATGEVMTQEEARQYRLIRDLQELKLFTEKTPEPEPELEQSDADYYGLHERFSHD
jgi:hypothetical protein